MGDRGRGCLPSPHRPQRATACPSSRLCFPLGVHARARGMRGVVPERQGHERWRTSPPSANGVGWRTQSAIEQAIDCPHNAVRNVALLPAPVWRSAVEAARLSQLDDDPLPLTRIAAAQAGLVCRVCKRITFARSGGSWADYLDVDPFALAPPVSLPTSSAQAPPAGRNSSSRPSRARPTTPRSPRRTRGPSPSGTRGTSSSWARRLPRTRSLDRENPERLHKEAAHHFGRAPLRRAQPLLLPRNNSPTSPIGGRHRRAVASVWIELGPTWQTCSGVGRCCPNAAVVV